MKNIKSFWVLMLLGSLFLSCKTRPDKEPVSSSPKAATADDEAPLQGLNFRERVDGFVTMGDLKIPSYFEINAKIEDIDAWEKDPEHKASISGAFYLENLKDKSWVAYTLEGTLTILNKREGKKGHFLEYDFLAMPLRSNASALNLPDITLHYKGHKTVYDDPGVDVIADTTTLKGFLLWAGENGEQKIPADYTFNIKDPANVWSFVKSFTVTNAPTRKQEFDTIIRFLKVAYRGVAEEFLPHVEKRRQSSS